jgi:predicted GNAT family acetyltransferase
MRGATSVLSSVPKQLSVEAAGNVKGALYQNEEIDSIRRRAEAGDVIAKVAMEEVDRMFDPREMGEYQAADRFDRMIRETFKVNPEYAEEFIAGQIPQGLGSAIGFMGATVLSGPVGGAAMGYMANAQESFEDALNNGATIDEATEASKLAGVYGLSEVVPLSNLLARLDKGTGGSVTKAIKNALIQGTEEAIQESTQAIWKNLVASDLIKYDKERGVFEGTVEGGSVGFTVGALMASIGTMLTGGRRMRMQKELGREMQTQVEEAVIPGAESEAIAAMAPRPTPADPRPMAEMIAERLSARGIAPEVAIRMVTSGQFVQPEAVMPEGFEVEMEAPAFPRQAIEPEKELIERVPRETEAAGVRTISTKGMKVRMSDLKIAEEDIAKGKPSVTPDAPVEVTYNRTTGEYELVDGYHRYLASRGGTIAAAKEQAKKGEFPDIQADIKIVQNVERGGFMVTEEVESKPTKEPVISKRTSEFDISEPVISKTLEGEKIEKQIEAEEAPAKAAAVEKERPTKEPKQKPEADIKAGIQSVVRKAHPGVDVSLIEREKTIELSKIIVPEKWREKGLGTKVVQNIIDQADKAGKTVTLTPSKDFGGTKARLIKFYKGLGFVENKGKNRDYEIMDSMYRTPKEPDVSAMEVPKAVKKAAPKEKPAEPPTAPRRKTFFADATTTFAKQQGYSSSITKDGMLRVFHGSSEKSIKKILNSGEFRGFPFFALDRETAEKFSKQAGGSPKVIEVIVDPDVIIPTGGYLTARIEGVRLGADNVWSAKQEPVDDYVKEEAAGVRAEAFVADGDYEYLASSSGRVGDNYKPMMDRAGFPAKESGSKFSIGGGKYVAIGKKPVSTQKARDAAGEISKALLYYGKSIKVRGDTKGIYSVNGEFVQTAEKNTSQAIEVLAHELYHYLDEKKIYGKEPIT